MYIKEQIESTFLPHLQNNINFILNDKKIKTGKLLLVSHKGPYVSFVLNINKAVKNYEIPYPFLIKKTSNDSSIIFDYSIETLSNNNFNTLKLLDTFEVSKTSKFYNKILKIQFN